MSPDPRETLATVQMLRFPSPTGLNKEAPPGARGRPHRWTVYLSICLLMPALAAMIGIVAWAISIEVANENTANLIAASQQSKQHLQKQQHKLNYLHLKQQQQKANQAPAVAADQDDQSSATWAKHEPVASAVVLAEEEARWEARLAAKRGASRRRVLPESQSVAVGGARKLEDEAEEQRSSKASATLLLTNINQLSSGGHSFRSKTEGAAKQSDSSSSGGQEAGSPTEATNGSENPEARSTGRGEPARREIMSGEEAVVEITGSSGHAPPAGSQWLHHQLHQQAQHQQAGKPAAEVSLEGGLVVDENNKVLMKKLKTAASVSKLAASKQALIKQGESTQKVAPPLPDLPEQVAVTSSSSSASIDSVSPSEEEDAALHGKSDGLIDYSGGSVPASGARDDELANNGASPGNNNDADEELGYAAIASAISTSLASDSALGAASTLEKPHTATAINLAHHPHHLEGDTGRESRVSSGWTEAEEPAGAARRRSAGENVAQVIDHIVERRKQSSNHLKGPQIVVVAPVGHSLMRAQSLTLEAGEQKPHLPPVQVDRRISSSELLTTGAIVRPKKQQSTNIRVKRNRPIGARLLGTGIEETTGSADRRMDSSSPGMRFSERIQVIEDDDTSALIGAGVEAKHQQRIQERGEMDEEVVDVAESSKVQVNEAEMIKQQTSPLAASEPRSSRQARHETRRSMSAQASGETGGANKLYLAEQVVREHVLRAQQRADKLAGGGGGQTAQVAPSPQSDKRHMNSISQFGNPPQPSISSALPSESPPSIKSLSNVDNVSDQPNYQMMMPQSGVVAEESQHNKMSSSPQLADQEFNVPAHMAESVIRQIERAPVEMIPMMGANQWPQYLMQQSANGLQAPYVPQHQQQQASSFMMAAPSETMGFWQQQRPFNRHLMHQPSTTDHSQLSAMQQMQQDQTAAVSGGGHSRFLGGSRQVAASNSDEQHSISTRASGPQQAIRQWLNSLGAHRSMVPVQQVAQARMPEPSQLEASSQEVPVEMTGRHATKTAQQEQNPQMAGQQEVQEVQDSYEQMSYQVPPSYGGYGGPPAAHHRPHYGGDDNEKKSKGLTFHFGGGPIGGGSQLITSPMGIFKHLMIPLLPNPRVNLNGKVVFGVVLEKSTAFGEPKKKFKFWG